MGRFARENAQYHPTLPRIMSGVLAASRTTLSTLTELKLIHQCFSSPADVLRLLALRISTTAILAVCGGSSSPEVCPFFNVPIDNTVPSFRLSRNEEELARPNAMHGDAREGSELGITPDIDALADELANLSTIEWP